MDVFEEVDQVLLVMVDEQREPLEHASTQQKVGVQGDEAEDGELAEERLTRGEAR